MNKSTFWAVTKQMCLFGTLFCFICARYLYFSPFHSWPFHVKQLVCHSSSHASVVASDYMELWPASWALHGVCMRLLELHGSAAWGFGGNLFWGVCTRLPPENKYKPPQNRFPPRPHATEPCNSKSPMQTPCKAQLAGHTSVQSDATTDAWEEEWHTSCCHLK